MAIKKLNRNNIGGVVNEVKVNPVVTEVKEEIIDIQEEVVNEVIEEVQEEVVNEVIEEKVETRTVNQPIINHNKNKHVIYEERKIGTVYPKDLLIKNIQAALSTSKSEKLKDLTLVDCNFILDTISSELLEACQIASVRFLGGLLSGKKRNAVINKSPAVSYSSFIGKRTVVTLRGVELGDPVKYQGNKIDDKTFEVTAAYNYETKKYEPASGTLVYDEKTNDWIEA